jgi:hypothetical protein
MLLPSKLPRARLLTWEYDDAYAVRGSVASKNRLIDHAIHVELRLVGSVE